MADLKALVKELDVVKTWFSPGSARHRKVVELADALAEHAGGRDEVAPGDPELATPGPGVNSPTVQVDSVGDIADTPPPVDLARTTPADIAKNKAGDNTPTS